MTFKQLCAQSSRPRLWSSYLGNLFEHYDAALFGFLSPFLAPLIFPKEDPLTALLFTYAMIPLGMVARPLGSLIFGYIGDQQGRERALFLTLVGMAFASGLIALSPTYNQAGILAPIFFCIGRLLQNFFAAGETMGGAIFLLEHSPTKRHDILSSLYSTSVIGGILLASLGVTWLSYCDLINPYWRLLYFLGCITGLFGFFLRQNPSIPVKTPTISFFANFWIYRKPFLLIVVSSGFSYATYSIALIMLNGFIPLVSSFTKTEMMSLNSTLLLLDFCALPLFGWLTSKMPREKMMWVTSLLTSLLAIPLLMLLDKASLPLVISIRICFVLLGAAFFAPFYAWAQGLIPSTYRYSALSIAYALGSQLLGGPTAAISLYCFQKTGLISSVAWYWCALATLTTLAIYFLSLKPLSVRMDPQCENGSSPYL